MKIRRDLRIGSESKVSVDAGLEGLKVISCWEDGRRKIVPVSRCHRNKRYGESIRSIAIQFKRVGMLNFRKSRIYLYLLHYPHMVVNKI